MRFKDVLAVLAIVMVAQCSGMSTRAEDEATPAKAQGERKAPGKDAKEAKKAEQPKVTIRGTVKDEDGKPVNDATVFLFASDNDGRKKGDELHKCHQIAKTLTSPSGEYEFKELDHPLFQPLVPPTLDVVVLAKDQRFAWRGPLDVAVAGDKRVRPRVIVPGTPAEINLEFRPTKPIAGVVVDEEGKPVAGAVIRLSDCRRNDRVAVGELPDNEWLNYPLGGKSAAAPDAIAKRTSDAEGKFAFVEMPVDMRAVFFVTHDDFSMVAFGATNAEDEQAGAIEGGLKFQRGDVKIKLRKSYPVPVEVKLGDSDEPAVGVLVVGIEIAAPEDQSAALSGEAVDKNGRVTLKLPTGKFKLRAGFIGSTVTDPLTEIVVDKAKRGKPIILRVNE